LSLELLALLGALEELLIHFGAASLLDDRSKMFDGRVWVLIDRQNCFSRPEVRIL
jgi:hypothetical protein